MERENPIETDPDVLAEVWRTAERRRSADIGAWLGQLFELRRRRLKVAERDAAYPPVHSAFR
jgi:hypothetical protein